jgi:ABC-2 type transport system ATP-binding protein
MVLYGSLDDIKAQHRSFTLHFAAALQTPPVITGAISVSGSGKEWTVMCNGARDELPAAAAKLGARIVNEHAPSLNEIFVAHARTVSLHES